MMFMRGTPFISSSSGNVTSRSTSSAAWSGHCVMISNCGGDRSGYASTGMRWKDRMPPIVMNRVNISTRNGCRSDAWTIRWIIWSWWSLVFHGFDFQLTLQRMGKLYEQAAVANHAVSRLQTCSDFSLTVDALADRYRPPAELTVSHLDINKRLVFAVAQDRRIWHRNGILDFARLDRAGYKHVLFQFLPGIRSFDARLKRSRGRIKRSRNKRYASLECIPIRIRLDRNRLSHSNVRQVLLIDVHKYPDRTRVGESEALGGAGLKQRSHR